MDAFRAKPPADRRVAGLAEAQHGIVTAVQLEAIGLGRGAIAHRVRAGRLHPVQRGVYAVGHARLTGHGRWMASVLALGEGAVLSHQAAAELWRLRRRGAGVVDVTVPARSGRRSRAGIRVHRSRSLAGNVTHRERIPVTTPARTLLDLSEVLTRRPLERAIDEAERLGLCDREALEALVDVSPGRAGLGRLRSVLDEHRVGSTLTRNDLEERFLALCRQARLPEPQVNAPVLVYEADFLWPAERLIVETDGRGSHDTHAAFQHDRERDVRLAIAGYRVLRFTRRDVARRPRVVAMRVRAILRALGRAV